MEFMKEKFVGGGVDYEKSHYSKARPQDRLLKVRNVVHTNNFVYVSTI